jgi:hypothetical protein
MRAVGLVAESAGIKGWLDRIFDHAHQVIGVLHDQLAPITTWPRASGQLAYSARWPTCFPRGQGQLGLDDRRLPPPGTRGYSWAELMWPAAGTDPAT